MKYYSIKPTLKKYNPQYLMTYGRRSRGKSWSTKETVIEEFNKTGRTFVYLRRYSEDLKSGNAVRYWDKFVSHGEIERLTHGKYSGIDGRANTYYLTREDDKGRLKKELCGYYLDLNSAERWKSQEFPNVKYIIFEEFITNQVYLDDEPNELQNLVSTIVRDNMDVVVIMLGNAISRVCPYFEEWGIEDIINQPQGTVKVYNIHSENEKTTRVVCERTEDTDPNDKGGKTLFFGNSAKSIMLGEWEVKDVPTRPRGTYETHYELRVKLMYMDFILQLQSGEDEQPFLFIYTNKHHRNTIPPRTIEDTFTTDPTITKYFRDEIPAERFMCDLWRGGRFCFSDRLTGNDFLQAMEQTKFVFDTHAYTL